jgi:hypothetical protein
MSRTAMLLGTEAAKALINRIENSSVFTRTLPSSPATIQEGGTTKQIA